MTGQQHVDLDALGDLIRTLRATRQLNNAEQARRRLEALRAAETMLHDAGDRGLGWVFVSEIADEQQHLVEQLEARDADREAKKQADDAAALARVAAELDGPACALDGGPSNPLIGPADWFAAVEAWTVERSTKSEAC